MTSECNQTRDQLNLLRKEKEQLSNEIKIYSKQNSYLSSANEILSKRNEELNEMSFQTTLANKRLGSQLDYLKQFLNW